MGACFMVIWRTYSCCWLDQNQTSLTGLFVRAGSSAGNQIFVSLKKGSEHPPNVIETRVRYEQTVGDIRKAVAEKAGIDIQFVQLFHHGKEMRPEEYDGKTLLEMDLHTGFSLMGYDTSVTPVYWPPVRQEKDGRLEVISALQEQS